MRELRAGHRSEDGELMGRPKGVPNPARVRRIVAMRNKGLTMRAIGEKFGITAQRVEQILLRHGGSGKAVQA